jgi:hypothetical protein
MLWPISCSRSGFGFSSNATISSGSIEPEDAHRRASSAYRLRRDGDVGAAVDVRVDHLVVVHAVEMIAGENQVVVGVVPREVPRRLPHGVGRSLVPVRIVGRLLGGEDLDEALPNRSIR